MRRCLPLFVVALCAGATRLAVSQQAPDPAARAAELGAAPPTAPSAPPSEPVRTVALHRLDERGLALDGHDPVAYFADGGGRAVPGDKRITRTFKGATYRFASEAHAQAFMADPARYEPAFGGWCAWAMAESGERVSVDPRSFLIREGRLLLFYDGLFADTRARWTEKESAAGARSSAAAAPPSDAARQAEVSPSSPLMAAADAAWRKLSGEEPRRPAPAAEAGAPGGRDGRGPESRVEATGPR